jgi:hypothetical protein
VPAEWRSNLGAFEAASDRAIKAGLIAAAETYEAAVKERLQVGYTSGAFTTGNAANSVARSTPEVTAMGYEIAIGSTQVEPPYPLYWEVGHQNLYTGKHERVEIWVPLMVEKREELVGIMAAEIKAIDGVL